MEYCRQVLVDQFLNIDLLCRLLPDPDKTIQFYAIVFWSEGEEIVHGQQSTVDGYGPSTVDYRLNQFSNLKIFSLPELDGVFQLKPLKSS